jgi:excisionase family DNA binding protein
MESNTRKLVNIIGLSQHKGIPVRTLRTLVSSRKIPFFKLGHRTLLFNPEKVDKALERFEVQEVGPRSHRRADKCSNEINFVKKIPRSKEVRNEAD